MDPTTTHRANQASHPTAVPDAGDIVIEEVRAVRRAISAEHGHDPHRLVEHYMRLQEQEQDLLVSYAPEPPEERAAA